MFGPACRSGACVFCSATVLSTELDIQQTIISSLAALALARCTAVQTRTF